MKGSKGLTHCSSETVCECSEIVGSPQGSPPAAVYVVVKLEGGPAASVKPGQKSCVRSSGIITLSVWQTNDGPGWSRLRRSHSDQGSRQGHQCSETTLIGESRFHISTPLGIKPGSFMTGSKGLTHWTSETCVNSEIVCSWHYRKLYMIDKWA
jgi:hypothetical protein